MASSENNPDGSPDDYTYWRNSTNKGGNPFADNMIADPDPGSDKSILHIEAYPNPTRGIINISVVATEETMSYDMVLTDLTGRVVYQIIAGTQASMDLKNTGVRPGIYTLKVSSGKLIGWVRIVFVN
jgi:hypothetical protein